MNMFSAVKAKMFLIMLNFRLLTICPHSPAPPPQSCLFNDGAHFPPSLGAPRVGTTSIMNVHIGYAGLPLTPSLGTLESGQLFCHSFPF